MKTKKLNTEIQTVDEIDAEMRELSAKRDSLESESFKAHVLPKLRDMIGTTLAYRRNSYSCPEKPSDYWDVFRLVLRVIEKDGGAWVVFQECAIDRDQRPLITVESSYISRAREDHFPGWKPCLRSEYEENYQRTLSAIARPDGYVEHLSEL